MTRLNDALLVQELVGDSLEFSRSNQGWPAKGMFILNGRRVPVELWIGAVGASHRGRDEVERRFQNPGRERPIRVHENALPLVLGIWSADHKVAVPAPVLTYVDAARRAGRSTRFSIFVQLESLLEAAAVGWSERLSSDAEWICSFRPEFLGRLVAQLTGPGSPYSPLLERGADGKKISQRSAHIAELARSGLTLQEIGNEVGVTRERVRQILKQQWPDVAERRTDASKGRRADESNRARSEANLDRLVLVRIELESRGVDPDAVMSHLRRTRHVEKTAQAFKLESIEVRRLYNAGPDRFQIRQARATPKRFSDEEMIDFLRTAASAMGVTTLTATAYDDFAAHQNITPHAWSSYVSIMKRFTTWRDACDIAGLGVGSKPRKYAQGFPAARCRAFADDYVRHSMDSGKTPTVAGYVAWAKSVGGPSEGTMRDRLGMWTEIFAASLGRIDGETD